MLPSLQLDGNASLKFVRGRKTSAVDTRAEGKFRPKIACGHTAADGGFCQADRLTDDAIVLNHTQFYGCATKAQQDEMVLRLMTLTKPQCVRLRPGQDVRQRDKSMSVKYQLMTSDAREQLQVCKATFIGVLG